MIAELKNSSVTKVGTRQTIPTETTVTQLLQEKKLESPKRKRRRRRIPTEETLTLALLQKVLKRTRKRIIRRSLKILRIMAALSVTC
jgi:hypothetical protein